MMLATLHRHGWTFRPRLAVTLATALLLPLLLALGNWQLHRAAQKTALRADWTERSTMPPLQLSAHDLPYSSPGELFGRHIAIQGRWDTDNQILLDNQVLDGQAGYWVFTPLRIADSASVVLVNRGWLPANPRRESAPDVHLNQREAKVEGIGAPPPSRGFLARQELDALLGAAGLLRVQQVDTEDLSQRLGLSLEPWTLRLDPTAPDGYKRQWQPPGLAPERHQAYALQWFLLAALVVGLYVKLNLRRS
jgi:surfeit locus 1 family protein